MNFEPGEINIICTNLTASRHFYEEILGFEFIEEEQGAVRLSCKQQNFLLLLFAKKPHVLAAYCEIAEYSIDLMTSDIKEAYIFLHSRKVTMIEALAHNGRSFKISDPDGLIIEIIRT